MGYCSDITIAIHKNIVAMDLISPIIPKALKDEKHTDYENGRYWLIEQWKWYDNYPEIQEIEAFFKKLDSMEAIETDSAFNIEVYGALRVGEHEDDIQTWGAPHDYEIYLNRSIDSPVAYL